MFKITFTFRYSLVESNLELRPFSLEVPKV